MDRLISFNQAKDMDDIAQVKFLLERAQKLKSTIHKHEKGSQSELLDPELQGASLCANLAQSITVAEALAMDPDGLCYSVIGACYAFLLTRGLHL